MFDLYPFQKKILQSLREKAAEHNKLLLQLYRSWENCNNGQNDTRMYQKK